MERGGVGKRRKIAMTIRSCRSWSCTFLGSEQDHISERRKQKGTGPGGEPEAQEKV